MHFSYSMCINGKNGNIFIWKRTITFENIKKYDIDKFVYLHFSHTLGAWLDPNNKKESQQNWAWSEIDFLVHSHKKDTDLDHDHAQS